jgi:hypothetical protein
MSDIVERLRAFATLSAMMGDGNSNSALLARDASAEIERLREAVAIARRDGLEEARKTAAEIAFEYRKDEYEAQDRGVPGSKCGMQISRAINSLASAIAALKEQS